MGLRDGGFCYIEPENGGELRLEGPEMRAWITFCVFLITAAAVAGTQIDGETEFSEQCICVSHQNGGGPCTVLKATGYKVCRETRSQARG